MRQEPDRHPRETLPVTMTMELTDLDTELGLNVRWSVSPNDLRNGGEGAPRLPIPPPPCNVPELAWKIQGSLKTDRLFLWRDDVCETEASFTPSPAYVRDGTLAVVGLRVIFNP